MIILPHIRHIISVIQFLNSSLSRAADVQGTLAAFGLAYVLVKFFVGILQEVKQVGVVLVHDRPGFHKILVSVLVMGATIFVILVLIGTWSRDIVYHS